jgi:hypothetical protein
VGVDGVRAGCGGGTSPPGGWPKQVTLRTRFAKESKPVRLADGAIVAAGGDVTLFHAVQLSLQSELDGEIFCPQGTFATLADVPTDEMTCPGSGSCRRTTRLFLSDGGTHGEAESMAIGLSALVRNAGGDVLYRRRVLGDSVSLNADGALGSATARFEYEPVR